MSHFFLCFYFFFIFNLERFRRRFAFVRRIAHFNSVRSDNRGKGRSFSAGRNWECARRASSLDVAPLGKILHAFRIAKAEMLSGCFTSDVRSAGLRRRRASKSGDEFHLPRTTELLLTFPIVNVGRLSALNKFYAFVPIRFGQVLLKSRWTPFPTAFCFSESLSSLHSRSNRDVRL